MSYDLALDMTRAATRLDTYAQCKADADTRIQENRRMVELVHRVSDALDQAGSWMDAEIVLLGRAKLDTFLKTRPSLARFAFEIQEVFRQA